MTDKHLPGSPVSACKPEDFDQEQLAKGTKVEKEHTTNKNIAQEIAMGHLVEHPDYYKELEKMEKKLEKKKGAHVYPVGDGNGTTGDDISETGPIDPSVTELGITKKPDPLAHDMDPYEDEIDRLGFGDETVNSEVRPSGVGTMEVYTSWSDFFPEVEQLNSKIAYNHFVDNCWKIIEAYVSVGASRQTTYAGIRRIYANVFEYKPWSNKTLSRFLDIYFGTQKRISSTVYVHYNKMVSYLNDLSVKGMDKDEAENMLYGQYQRVYDAYGEDFERLATVCVDYMYGPRLARFDNLTPGCSITYVWDKNCKASVKKVTSGEDFIYVDIMSDNKIPTNVPVNRFIVHSGYNVYNKKENTIRVNNISKILIESDYDTGAK